MNINDAFRSLNIGLPEGINVAVENDTVTVTRTGDQYKALHGLVRSLINNAVIGTLRGAGDTKPPMIINLVSFVAFRQLYLFIMSQVCYEIVPIAMAYPAGWLICSLANGIYYHKTPLDRHVVVEPG